MTIEERIKEIEGRLGKATKGEWLWELDHIRDGWEKQYSLAQQKSMEKDDWDSGRIALRANGQDILKGWGGDGDEGLTIRDKFDMDFIAHSKDDIIFLLSELKRYKRALELITYAPNCTVPRTDEAVKEMMLEIANEALHPEGVK